MKFLVCGTLVPEKYETQIEQLSNAGNRFLMNFCNALKKQGQVTVASYLGIRVDADVKSALEEEARQAEGVFYHYTSKYKLKGILDYARAVKVQIKECDCVIAYNTVYAWLYLPSWARCNNKKSVLILADYSPKESFVGRFRQMYAEMQLRSIRKYDYVIGLSENTKLYLKPEQHFICMEGGIAQQFYDYYAEEKLHKDDKIIIQYAGILESVTGIERLIEAFHSIENSNYILRISGKGSLKSWVEEMAAFDTRIQYLGCLSYDKYMSNLYEADILVNPRNMELKENANNFPSKIMEYLATGKRVISTKFPGWERFTKHVLFCESDVDSIKAQLIEAAKAVEKRENNSFQERRDFAKQFIWEKQMERILTFLK